MKLCILACNGQLGVDATEYFSKKHEVVAYRDAELDITDQERLLVELGRVKPDVVLNCAAITNVDACEKNPDPAYAVNAKGAGNVAEAAWMAGAAVAHISTDYVFSGEATQPYHETDPTGPQTVYGKSKLEGEKLVVASNPRHFILRTAWLYGHNGNNFVKTMLRLGRENGAVDVVTDQFGNPTSSTELVRVIDAVISAGTYGVFHATCEDVCSWNEFAREIFRAYAMDVQVRDVTSAQFVRPAKRPAYSGLSKDKLRRVCGYTPATWREALAEYRATEPQA